MAGSDAPHVRGRPRVDRWRPTMSRHLHRRRRGTLDQTAPLRGERQPRRCGPYRRRRVATVARRHAEVSGRTRRYPSCPTGVAGGLTDHAEVVTAWRRRRRSFRRGREAPLSACSDLGRLTRTGSGRRGRFGDRPVRHARIPRAREAHGNLGAGACPRVKAGAFAAGFGRERKPRDADPSPRRLLSSGERQ
jgi:hypothetical protein